MKISNPSPEDDLAHALVRARVTSSTWRTPFAWQTSIGMLSVKSQPALSHVLESAHQELYCIQLNLWLRDYPNAPNIKRLCILTPITRFQRFEQVYNPRLQSRVASEFNGPTL